MLLNIRALKAVATAASTERYYLNGVHLHVANGFATMVATDGHVLLAYRHAAEGDANAIIPLDLIKRIKLTREDNATLTIENGLISIIYAGCHHGANAIDAVFPAWRNVVPRGPYSGETAQYAPDKLKILADAARILGSKPIIAHNGQDPALVRWHDDALGVIMPLPLSAYTVPTAPPAWSI